MDFCIESQLRILNGRTFGDTQGMYTSYKYNGNSVVDYMITSEHLLPQLLYFNVILNKPRLSDHSRICCKSIANYFLQKSESTLITFPTTYKWSSTSADSFKDALCSSVLKQMISDFESLDKDLSTDLLLSKLDDIFITDANVSLRKKVKQNYLNSRWLKSSTTQIFINCAKCLPKKATCMLNIQMIH